MSGRAPFVLFCAAAGPRRGYGHLARCGFLADALGLPRQIALCGPDSSVEAAIGRGWTVHRGSIPTLTGLLPDLIVVDDPSSARASAWTRAARRLGVPVAVIEDRITPCEADNRRGSRERTARRSASPDLVINGVLRPGSATANDGRLDGSRFLVLDPALQPLRARPPQRAAGRVLIALGGGTHVRTLGVTIARLIARRAPQLRIDLAAGIAYVDRLPRLPRGCRWITAPRGLATQLATATVAVVGGGITLAEALALGTPAVAVPVVAAQRPAIRVAREAGAVLEASAGTGHAVAVRAAGLALSLIASPVRTAQLARRARRVIDGAGAVRAATRLRRLLLQPGADDRAA
jgi:spore coat polysaccharide biosynthesis predicted glycosyltransferase SpsG